MPYIKTSHCLHTQKFRGLSGNDERLRDGACQVKRDFQWTLFSKEMRWMDGFEEGIRRVVIHFVETGSVSVVSGLDACWAEDHPPVCSISRMRRCTTICS